MARLDPPTLEELTPEQKAIYSQISRGRPRVTGPFGVLLRVPPVADAANKLVAAIRETGRLDQRQYELIVMTVAAHAQASYAWAVHDAPAKNAGIPADALEAMRTGKKPDFARTDERLIHGAVTSLLQTGKLPDDQYQALVAELGLEKAIEVITCAGLYCMIGMIINGFEVPTPNGERPFG